MHEDEDLEDELKARFEQATTHVRKIAGKLGNDQLLRLYARFKQAQTGPCNTKKPGFFDFEGKQKWEAWKKLGEMNKEQAMVEYINELLQADPSWSPDLSEEGRRRASSESGGTGMGIAVSIMAHEEDEEISDDQKTIFDWVKEGSISRVKNILDSSDNGLVNQSDEQGLSLLHWACDRGHLDIVEELLKCKCDVNAQDEDGLTPLHYAVTCEFLPVIQVLLQNGANPALQDNDGCLPSENTYNKEIISLLQR
ncbi:acyl-CoA-binding domain-containing protein 6-like [Ptychodera flava]|uniref:acyl-CoA-binding domain-containing protein 6-like n=1 Tax=Ptychodera flava TaxID=63121 RepID=UPI00396A1837